MCVGERRRVAVVEVQAEGLGVELVDGRARRAATSGRRRCPGCRPSRAAWTPWKWIVCGCSEPLTKLDPQPLALAGAQRRAGDAAVVGPGGVLARPGATSISLSLGGSVQLAQHAAARQPRGSPSSKSRRTSVGSKPLAAVVDLAVLAEAAWPDGPPPCAGVARVAAPPRRRAAAGRRRHREHGRRGERAESRRAASRRVKRATTEIMACLNQICATGLNDRVPRCVSSAHGRRGSASPPTTRAHRGVGLLDRSERGKLALTGAEAAEFLHGQVTQRRRGAAPTARAATPRSSPTRARCWATCACSPRGDELLARHRARRRSRSSST